MIVLIIAIISACGRDTNFSIEGTIEGEYTGYIYLKYDGIIDSTLVENNQFYFRGKVEHPVEASFRQAADQPVANSFFFANEDLKIVLAPESSIFLVKEVSGSPTMVLVEETILNVRSILDENPNPNQKLYDFFKKLISENPNNPFVGDIYVELVTEANFLTLDQVNELSAMLEPSALDESSRNSLKRTTDRMEGY